jgi:hypothetical protein
LVVRLRGVCRWQYVPLSAVGHLLFAAVAAGAGLGLLAMWVFLLLGGVH